MAITALSQAVLQGMDPNIYRPLQDMQQGDAMSQVGLDASPTTKWGAIGRLANALAGSYVTNSATSDLAKAITGNKASAKEKEEEMLTGLQQNAAVPQAAPAMTSQDQPVGAVTPPTNSARPPVQSSPKVWGDDEAVAAGLYDPKPTSPTPPAPQQLAQGPSGVQPNVPAPQASQSSPQPAQQLSAPAVKRSGPDPHKLLDIIDDPNSSDGAKAIAQGILKDQLSPKPDAWSNAGEGYIINSRTGEVKVGHPVDKAPSGFEQNPDGSGIRPIAGGPASLEYLKSKMDAVGSHLDDQTVKDMAGQYLAGDRTVLQNLGRGAQGAENIVKLRQEISNQARAQGYDPKDIVNNFNEQAGALSGQRAIGTRAANISLAANEANNMIPIALEASDKLPRSQYMPWNQAVQAYQKGTSSPELASFVAATNSLVNSYVRAVSPSGVPTDAMRQHAYDMLNAAQGPDAYKAVVNTMKQEMQAALQAPGQVREELKRGNGAAPQVPAANGPAATPAGPAAGPTEGTIAVNPTTKERVILKSGQWVPFT